jgi:NADPH-dependent F420 reductase
MRVAVVGGTGSFGRAVAKRLVGAGVEVVIGSRDAARAVEAAEPLGADGANNDDAVRGADLVLFAVKADAAVDSARELRQSIGSTPVFSVCAELAFGPGGVKPTAEATSVAQRIQDELDAPVVAGLHSLAASNLDKAPPDEDAFICGDDASAKELALELAGRLVAGRAVDCGPLASARALEGMTAVIVNVNKRYKAHAGLRLTGLPGPQDSGSG